MGSAGQLDLRVMKNPDRIEEGPSFLPFVPPSISPSLLPSLHSFSFILSSLFRDRVSVIYSRMTLNSWSSCFHLPSAGFTGMCHLAFYFCEMGFHTVAQASLKLVLILLPLSTKIIGMNHHAQLNSIPVLLFKTFVLSISRWTPSKAIPTPLHSRSSHIDLYSLALCGRVYLLSL